MLQLGIAAFAAWALLVASGSLSNAVLDQASIASEAVDERVEALRREPEGRTDLFAGNSRPQRRASMRRRQPSLDARRQCFEPLATDQCVS